MTDSAYESYVVELDEDDIEEEEEQPSLTYRLDLEKNRIIGVIDEKEAVVQAAVKAILTPRFKHLLYDDQYGSEIEEILTASNVTRSYIKASIKSYIEDALSQETRILRVYDVKVKFASDEVWIQFNMDTIFGETQVEEVVQRV